MARQAGGRNFRTYGRAKPDRLPARSGGVAGMVRPDRFTSGPGRFTSGGTGSGGTGSAERTPARPRDTRSIHGRDLASRRQSNRLGSSRNILSQCRRPVLQLVALIRRIGERICRLDRIGCQVVSEFQAFAGPPRPRHRSILSRVVCGDRILIGPIRPPGRPHAAPRDRIDPLRAYRSGVAAGPDPRHAAPS